MRKEMDFIENVELREEFIDRLEVLDKVGDLLLLPNTEFATTRQVATYYNVGVEAIKSICSRHNEELIRNGLKYMSAKETKEFLVSCNLQPATY